MTVNIWIGGENNMKIWRKMLIHGPGNYHQVPLRFKQQQSYIICSAHTNMIREVYDWQMFQISENLNCRPAIGFMGCTFHNCIFVDCEFDQLTFSDCTFQNCCFVNVTAERGILHFSTCNMTHCSFEYEKDKETDITFSGVIGDDIHFFFLDEERKGYLISESLPGISLRFDLCILGSLELDCLCPANVTNDTSMFTSNISENMASLLNPICSEGTIIGYKKALFFPDMDNLNIYKGMKYVIVKLEIPADARRFSGLGRKCRCDKAKVLDIYDVDDCEKKHVVACSGYDTDFRYVLGREVCEPEFDPSPEMCSCGIHFFISEKEAKEYVI